jgi:hypothetical protein
LIPLSNERIHHGDRLQIGRQCDHPAAIGFGKYSIDGVVFIDGFDEYHHIVALTGASSAKDTDMVGKVFAWNTDLNGSGGPAHQPTEHQS